ncbi:MAG TPA: GTPase HflX [Verrucomicrobia bacterium]|nr:MAG: GTPase HflX [Lentisphaerae bacterium GWF2_57_35]HBA85400.1 GTPase HflX [Verrucomicrobiota bacterium]
MDQLLSLSENAKDRALLIGVVQRSHKLADVEDSLDELAQLASTSGAVVADRVICRQPRPHPATFLGRGKIESLAERVLSEKLTMVVFDDDLSPAQGRNLEELMKVKILDRTQMILDIFAQHARTKEGSLQIELARLQYLLPRLRHMWKHLERQRGGIGVMGGAGEQQMEVDRRRIQERIDRLGSEIEQVRLRRAEQRRGRRRHGWALITLVGYTNAGKSTLLNTLTGAHVLAYDQLFATLDPTTRQLQLPNNQNALITDTVGFIRKLPHHLVDAFKATLEEVLEADILLHVIDASHPKVDEQIEAVEGVLKDLGASMKFTVAVLNKIDLPGAAGQWHRLSHRFQRAVAVSALTGEGLEELRDELADCLRDRSTRAFMRLPLSEGQLLAQLKSVGKVFSEHYENESVLLDASLPNKMVSRYQAFFCEAQNGVAAPEELPGDATP